MPQRFLTALPVYNEQAHVADVLREVLRYSREVLVVDDGSTDGTPQILAGFPQVRVVRHPQNRGYGAALRTAFEYARRNDFPILLTIDCDGQHEPQRIPQFVAACDGVDLVSGSRYLQPFPGDTPAPPQRRRVNEIITGELNRLLGLRLTDAFCGFKAYRTTSLAKLRLTETGYAMPLELWVQAAVAGWKIKELPVPLIYLEESRSFGGALDDARTRLAYYREVLQRAMVAAGLAAQGQAIAFCGDLAG